MNYKKLWSPSKQWSENSQMFEFMQLINKKYNKGFRHYDELHRWSVNNISEFWKEVWDYTGIIHSKGYDEVVDDITKMPGAKWFHGAHLNYAENLLQRRDDHPAIIFLGEDRVRKTISYKELYLEVASLSEGLRRSGVRKGDRVAGFIPNMPEAIIAMLATASIGAIWSSSSPDFGIKGVLDRFSQIKPKVIFAADGYYYKGKTINSQDKLLGILDKLPSVEKVVLIEYTQERNVDAIPKAMAWEDIQVHGIKDIDFEQLPFDHPLYIMYSSGTTGLPKSMVHSAGGTLIQHLKELILHCDLTPGQTILYYTTCGWMMWNWVASSLAVGATLVSYDGNPFYPTPDAMLKMADELDINIFGTSAKYIASLEGAGVKPCEISDFPELKVILSTGSPLSGASFEYIYRDWKSDIQLSSISGGTDIISCFVLGNPMLPVYKEEIQCKGLGMDVDSFDEEGNSITDSQGVLVCKSPFPSMPVYFWNDPDNTKYFSSYFETYPGIWYHGDYIKISDHGGVTMLGRSDATLNPGGVRIGTSEIYSVLDKITEVADAVVVGQKYHDDERVILFVKLANAYKLDDELKQKISSAIRTNCSPRHVPAVILETIDIPYTLNGKKVEVAVKKIIHGQEVKNRDALANPGCLEDFMDRPELR